MFKVITEPTFTHDVPIEVPSDDGHAEQKLRTRFRVLDDDTGENLDLGSKDGMIAFLKMAVVQFEDVADENGKALSYSDALRDQLLARPYIRLGLLNHYIKTLTKVRQGN